MPYAPSGTTGKKSEENAVWMAGNFTGHSTETREGDLLAKQNIQASTLRK
jgi:hypothetical protein